MGSVEAEKDRTIIQRVIARLSLKSPVNRVNHFVVPTRHGITGAVSPILQVNIR
jgi:hypothetical protein